MTKITRCQAKNRSTCRKHGDVALGRVVERKFLHSLQLTSALDALEDAKSSEGSNVAALEARVAELTAVVDEDVKVMRDASPDFEARDRNWSERHAYCEALGVDPYEGNDTQFGSTFVYCSSHLYVHHVGWCTVSNERKAPLVAKNELAARDEAKACGFKLR